VFLKGSIVRAGLVCSLLPLVRDKPQLYQQKQANPPSGAYAGVATAIVGVSEKVYWYSFSSLTVKFVFSLRSMLLSAIVSFLQEVEKRTVDKRIKATFFIIFCLKSLTLGNLMI